MSDAAPPLPPGFSMDADDGSVASDDTTPPLPSGFKLDSGEAGVEDTSLSHRALGVGELAATAAGNLLPAAGNAAIDLGSRIAGFGTGNNRIIPEFSTGQAGQDVVSDIKNSTLGKAVSGAAHTADQWVGQNFGDTVQDVMHQAGHVAGDVGAILPVAKGASMFRGAAAEVPAVADAPALTAQENLSQQVAKSPQNMGAAATTPSLDGMTPETQQVIANAKNINFDALERQRNAETLPMPEGTKPEPLTLGQATRDDQQISDEFNLRSDPDTQGHLTKRLSAQGDTMSASMGEIRRQATPDIVQRSTPEHAQVNIDAIKDTDNGLIADNRRNYKALQDAAGGVSMPIDSANVLGTIKNNLSEKLLTETAEQDPVISAVMTRLSSGKPMPFETYHSALSNLSSLQARPGAQSVAAGVVQNALENMPLTDEFSHLTDLRDVATSGAKKRFDIIDQNPAYKAAINDNVPKTKDGFHQVGAPSPLADKFMDSYYLGNGPNASRAYVSRIKNVMQGNSEFAPSIEAASLNKLRDAAKLDQYDSGNFAGASFRSANRAMAPKADVLMSAQSADNIDRLQRYSDDVAYEGKGASKNRSGTMPALIRYGAQFPAAEGMPSLGKAAAGKLADWGSDLAAVHSGPLGYAGLKAGKLAWKWRGDAAKVAQAKAAEQSVKDAKLKFAQDATAPGAGIDTPSGSPIIARASGGRVDHEALTNRLFQRWKQAQKDADETTKPLLKFPDATITKALRIAQSHPIT